MSFIVRCCARQSCPAGYLQTTPDSDFADAVNVGAPGTQNAGFTDWRVPNINELKSLVEQGCVSPSINLTQFPTTTAWFFWSGSPIAGLSDGAWYVNFYDGDGYWSGRYDAVRVRLVRAGQYFYNVDAAATAAGLPFRRCRSGRWSFCRC